MTIARSASQLDWHSFDCIVKNTSVQATALGERWGVKSALDCDLQKSPRDPVSLRLTRMTVGNTEMHSLQQCAGMV